MNIYIALCIISGIILLDQCTKIIAKKILTNNKTIHIIKDKYYFTYLENSGIAMGKYSGKYIYFYIATVLSLAMFSFLLIYMNNSKLPFYGIGLSLLIGGTIGNFLDRILRGYVIDFITGKFFKWHLPVYNIADVAILFGTILTVIFAFIEVY